MINTSIRPTAAFTQGNPISQLQNWSAEKKSGKAPDGFTYEAAIDTVQKDCAYLQSLDNQYSNSYYGYNDSDQRPGEVTVSGVGHLESTEQGFNVALTTAGRSSYGLSSYSNYEGDHRSYAINSENGTITVENTIGASSRGYNLQVSSTPAVVERYTLDTEQGTIADYSRVPVPSETGQKAVVSSNMLPRSEWNLF